MYPISRNSARLALRELTVDDVDAVHAIYGSEPVTEHLSFTPRSRDQVGGIVARSIASATTTPRQEYALAVTRRESGELIGYTRLATDPHQQQAATFGFALRFDTWGSGYGRETVGLVFDLAFADLGLHRLWAARSPLNVASGKTLLAVGMTEEGRIRAHVHVRGAWRDSIIYGILREEWAAETSS
ncbi:GNAT family N-acetyltransferase [Streptomyces zagrosensis]|uniref:RimJ/RimL family protein N-acetyltransferase n=1 Tax=Streptomyces zagrosensis TaxID=1042984 RepID=A0A7W9QI66_9ACTN|nr:GNAT family protein [Streptomyces zagrosensis]MBB5940429.1 RimJ/RimL family protein N-acetyltransferase [Streptomyces zagrosensis]